MLSKNVTALVKQHPRPINREMLALKIAVIGLLGATTLIDIMMPHGLIVEAGAAEAEFRLESQMIQHATAHPNADVSWGKLSEAKLAIQQYRINPLEANQG